MTSKDLHEACQASYPAPNYIYLKEVRDATGFDAVRSADALAIGMYRSCGRLIHGFEMKVSRSDWLRELSNAAKAESIMRYCHHWSLIVPDAAIVHDGELPPTWGLGVPYQSRKGTQTKIKWIVKPPLLEPQAPSMVFLSALIYAVQKVDEPERNAALSAQFELGVAEGKQQALKRSGDYVKLQTLVDAFEQASGVRIAHYSSVETMQQQGLAFQEWRRTKGSVDQHKSSLLQLKKSAEYALTSIEASLKGLEPNDTIPTS